MGVFDSFVTAITGEDVKHLIADTLQHAGRFPAITANIIFAQNINCMFAIMRNSVTAADNMFHQTIISDMVTCRLAYAPVTFTAKSHTLDIEGSFGPFSNCLNIIAN